MFKNLRHRLLRRAAHMKVWELWSFAAGLSLTTGVLMLPLGPGGFIANFLISSTISLGVMAGVHLAGRKYAELPAGERACLMLNERN